MEIPKWRLENGDQIGKHSYFDFKKLLRRSSQGEKEKKISSLTENNESWMDTEEIRNGEDRVRREYQTQNRKKMKIKQTKEEEAKGDQQD